MSGFENLVRNIRASFIFAFLVGTCLVGNVLQLLTLAVRPFSPRTFRELNCWLVAQWWRMLTKVVQWCGGVQPVLSGHLAKTEENALLVVNHQSMTDIAAILTFADLSDRLNVLKWFVKAPLRHLPGIGWGLQFLDILFVKRRWYEDRAKIEATFAKFRREKIPYWLISFSEGTRSTADKIAESQAFARSKGLPVLEHVLIPRSRGFVAAVEGLRGTFAAVYDITLAFEPKVCSLWQVYRGELSKMHIHVDRYPIEALPRDEKGLSDWLLARFVEKDRRLTDFQRTKVLK